MKTNWTIRLQVDKEDVALNAFASRIITSVVLGMVSSLKIPSVPTSITLHLERAESEEEEREEL
ncbi:MAG: hypothetical protein D6805_04420 [Planctomycetota bacterium]|nr:MAG: hypothetical protein D6805_04420 [Planctomycetota bacterium]